MHSHVYGPDAPVSTTRIGLHGCYLGVRVERVRVRARCYFGVMVERVGDKVRGYLLVLGLKRLGLELWIPIRLDAASGLA